MKIRDLRWFAERVNYGRNVNLYLAHVGEDGEMSEAVSVEFRVRPPGGAGVSDGFVKMSQDEAQQLADALWDAGVRPAEAAGSAGSFGAQGRHLEDMRRLVFKGEGDG